MKIYEMKTDLQIKPIGIDNSYPMFSWKMDSNERGAFQSAYQIIVSESESFEDIVWNSGKISSDISVGIEYKGEGLKSETRYYWTVNIWGKNDDMYSGQSEWFETGLMGKDKSVWNSAEWIGNPKPSINTHGLYDYALSTDFQIETGSKAGIVIAARNKDNYVLIEADMGTRLMRVYEYCDNAWNGCQKEGNVPTITIRGDLNGYTIPKTAVKPGEEFDQNHIEIIVNKRALTVKMNGVSVIDNADEVMPHNEVHKPRKESMMSIGFKQENNCVVYNNIKIVNTQTKEVYQHEKFLDESSIISALGDVIDGKLKVENRFEIICPVPSVNVRKIFEVNKKIKTARLYASAMGFYNAYINGKKVGKNFYDPGFTDYRYRIQYQTFDVTELIESGINTIGAVVGKGYYTGYVGYVASPMVYGTKNSFIAKLSIKYDDGSEDVIVTDKTWRFTEKGPVTDSDFQQGESYDARLEFDWNDVCDRRWKDCGIINWPTEVEPTNGSLSGVNFSLTAQSGGTAKVTRVLQPINVQENPKGHFIYDFGQNMVGTVSIRLQGQRGISIKLRYGEMCYKNGEIYVSNLRTAANTDTYTLKGGEKIEEFVPAFTSHGFRYVEITGNGLELTDDDIILSIEGLAVCNTENITGDFECSNSLINQLQKNIQWGQRGNYLLIPTDCPQRNERMGWTGDAQVFAKTSAYNMDVATFTRKWLQDVMDAQMLYNMDGAIPDTAPLGGDNRKTGGCAGWGDAAVIVPWEMYKAYGDINILEECYDMMAAWIEYQSREYRQNCGMRTVNGIEMPERSDLASCPYIQIQQSRGDHLAFDESTPFILSATAYAAYVAELMVKIAEVLGKKEDAEKYRKRYENVRNAFQQAWVKDDGTLAYWGEMSNHTKDKNGNVINETYYSNESGNENHPSQTAYALAIDFGLIPKDKLAKAAKCLKKAIDDRDGKLSVGFLGISHLASALTKSGLTDYAFELLEQEGNPGWLYSVKNGATTIWERWNSYIEETGQFGDVSMNSFNHYAYGAIGEWMFSDILGINTSEIPGETGYKKIVLKPTLGGKLSYAKGYHESPYGRIESEWKLNRDGYIYNCTVPSNTKAILYLPSGDNDLIFEGGVPVSTSEGIEYIGTKNNRNIYSLVSGRYSFNIKHV